MKMPLRQRRIARLGYLLLMNVQPPATERPLLVSVIVPAYNAAQTIGVCVEALHRQTVASDQYEILVVDDASTDDTAAVAEAAGACVIRLPHNQGRSQARNIGAQAARGAILLFTDADCEPTPTWMAHMLAPFQRDPTVMGVKGAYWTRQKAVVARFTQLELEDKYDHMARQTSIAFIDTYSAAYRREPFHAHHGFDASLSYSMVEDQDLSFRLAAAGHHMVFAPEARVYHRHTPTLGQYYHRKRMIGRSKVTILQRYPDRMVADSRTPRSLQLQFGIVGLAAPLALLAAVWLPARRLLVGLGGVFVASSLPFFAKALRRDPTIAWAVLPMLLIRALALAHGYGEGLMQAPELRHTQRPETFARTLAQLLRRD